MAEELFGEYDAFNAERLRLPIRGKQYLIPEVGAADAITLRLAAEDDEASLRKLADPVALKRLLLGAAYDEMIADNVPVGALERAARTAMADFNFGRIAALQVWSTGQDPEAWAAVMAATHAILATP